MKSIYNQLKITGGKPLKGKISIGPAKNALLPMLASMLATKDIVILPISNLIDIQSKIELLKSIGYIFEEETSNVLIRPSEEINGDLPSHLVNSIRSSILFLGPLLALKKSVTLYIPGGDNLGRLFNFHIECLEKMGAKITINNNYINAILPHDEKLKGTEYSFTKPSVGATQHMLITALLCEKGTVTTLHNCSQEPECLFIMEVLKNKFKGNITKKGTTITIVGEGDRLSTGEVHTINLVPDRIEALTYLSLALITNGEITVEGKNLTTIIGGNDLDLLVKIGGDLNIKNNSITIKKANKDEKLSFIKYFESSEYPGISTDFAPIFCSLLGISEGTSIFTETIHPSRFKYIDEMNKFGGSFNLHKKPNTILINGSDYVSTNDSICTDIRGGMGMLMAALRADGVSILNDTFHIFRGYEYFIEKINSLGGKIEPIIESKIR
jgi:UDP-N-acetylglucosamine 1-carboxyvinyltransferase